MSADAEFPEIEGWAVTSLREIGVWSTGGTPSRKQSNYFDGEIAWVKSGDLKDGPVKSTEESISELGLSNCAAKLLPSGTVMMALYGATIGKLGVLEIEAATNQACASCRVHDSIADRKFLFYYLLSQRRQFIDVAQGGAQPNLTNEIVRDWPIAIPPLAEQQRIVAKVEELLVRVNVARERLAKAPTILKRFRQSVLAAACSGQLTADWRDRIPSISKVVDVIAALKRKHQANGTKKMRSRKGANAARNEGDDADGLDLSLMPDLPDTWAYARADEIVEPGTVVTYGIVLPGPQLEKGVPYVRGLDIENGRVLVDQLWRTTEEIARKHERSRLEPGDVLLCIIRHLKVAIVPKALRGGNLTQGTVRLRPSSAISGTYLARYLESPIAQSWLKSRYFGMDMPRVNVEDARAIPVPVPPIEEQREIVRRLEALWVFADKIESRVHAATARVEKTTQAILAKAFRGELVPTEAELARQENRTYEPAAALLARIRTTHATKAATTTPSRRETREANGRAKAVLRTKKAANGKAVTKRAAP